jgi:hypothetical protein
VDDSGGGLNWEWVRLCRGRAASSPASADGVKAHTDANSGGFVASAMRSSPTLPPRRAAGVNDCSVRRSGSQEMRQRYDVDVVEKRRWGYGFKWAPTAMPGPTVSHSRPPRLAALLTSRSQELHQLSIRDTLCRAPHDPPGSFGTVTLSSGIQAVGSRVRRTRRGCDRIQDGGTLGLQYPFAK